MDGLQSCHAATVFRSARPSIPSSQKCRAEQCRMRAGETAYPMKMTTAPSHSTSSGCAGSPPRTTSTAAPTRPGETGIPSDDPAEAKRRAICKPQDPPQKCRTTKENNRWKSRTARFSPRASSATTASRLSLPPRPDDAVPLAADCVGSRRPCLSDTAKTFSHAAVNSGARLDDDDLNAFDSSHDRPNPGFLHK